jgi:hypothetical protein
MDIFGSATITSDAGIQRIVTINSGLPTSPIKLKLDDAVLSIFLMYKLDPNTFGTLRDSVVINDSVPSVLSLRSKVQDVLTFHGAAHESVNGAFTTAAINPRMICFNCDKKGVHPTRECDQPAADCDLCGPAANHLPKHCLIKSNRPPPAYWSDDRKARLDKQRAAFKSGGAAAVAALVGSSSNACLPCDDADTDEAFWEMIRGLSINEPLPPHK